jgi:hemolysin activation/secretion protein
MAAGLVLPGGVRVDDPALPRTPPAHPATLPTRVTATRLSGDEIVVPVIQTIILEDAMGSTTRPETGPFPPGVVVRVSGVRPSAAMIRELEGYLGRAASLGDLGRITARLVEDLSAQDRPVVDVLVPEQDVTEGVIRFQVIEGRLGRVRFEGSDDRTATRLERNVRLAPSSPIRSSAVLDELSWIQRYPFRRASAVFEPGSEPGTTDLVLMLEESVPFRPFAGYENTGTKATGVDRMIAGFHLGNVAGMDDVLSVQSSVACDPSEFHAHGLTYSVPMPWRAIVSVGGSFARSRPDLQDFQNTGESWQSFARYAMPLPGSPGIQHSAFLGAEFKRSNNNLLFGGTEVFDSRTEVLQFQAGYEWALRDSAGVTSARANLVWSPGGLTARNEDDDFGLARPGARSDYVYATFRGERVQELGSFQASTRLSGQISSGRLLASEQFGLGGIDTVRGFDERIVNGDAGAAVSLEVRSPAFQPMKWLGKGHDDEELRFFVFADMGYVFNRGGGGEESSDAHMVGAGPGLRYRLGDTVFLEYAYGWNLLDRGIEDAGDGRHHLRVFVQLTW